MRGVRNMRSIDATRAISNEVDAIRVKKMR
jgi:hypothetical protein